MSPPPPVMEKLKSQVKVTFWFWLMYPPPRNEKVGSQVNMTYWFWMMYPPPHWLIEINMNAIENNWGHQVLFTNLPPPPPPPPSLPKYNLILCLNRKLVNFNFNWIWILGLKPHLPPLSRSKIEMLVVGLRSTSDDWPGWSMDSNPICHPSPAQKMFIFGLHSTSDDQLSDLSKKCQLKCKKMKKAP